MESSAPRPPPRRRVPRAATLAVAGALALSTAPAAAAPSAAEGVRGTYRLAGTARVDAGAVLSRTLETRGDAVLRPTGRGDALRVRLAAQGHACELDATLGGAGAIAFAPGQRCAFDVDDPGARGRVEVRLRAGRGTLRGRKLSLDLAWELSGRLSLHTGRAVELLGRTVELPAAWTPEVPVRGDASVTAEGDRDDSRAVKR